MGLDTSHDAWHGPYSLFSRWRKWLAQFDNIALDEMIGFGGNIEWSDQMKALPLYPLLNHSDCDGILTTDECKRVAEGLQSIIDTNPDHEQHLMYCIRFRDGCMKAHSTNDCIYFH